MTGTTKTAKKPIMNPALREFWRTKSRFKVLYGGRASSKSWDAAANSIRITSKIKTRFLCTRMFQNRIEESVYTTIKKQIDRFSLSQKYRIMNNKIVCTETGSDYLFYGLARNIDEIKSLEGTDVLWLEEAHSLTEEMWDVLEPTIRKEGSEIWIVFNPRLATDFAYQRFVVNPPPNAVVRKINYDENQFLSNTILETIEHLENTSPEDYNHIYLGMPKSNDDESIIKRKFVEAAIDAHKKLDIDTVGVNIIGYDVADSGEDKNALTKRSGILIHSCTEWKGGEHELMKSANRVYQSAEQKYMVRYDSIGVGASIGSKLSEINETKENPIKFEPFNAGGGIINAKEEYRPGVTNEEQFSNLKSQTWWAVADRFRNTYEVLNGGNYKGDELISIDSDCENLEKLITELTSPKIEYDGKGRVRVESKKNMAKRGIKSPNLADSFVMCFAPHSKPASIGGATINF